VVVALAVYILITFCFKRTPATLKGKKRGEEDLQEAKKGQNLTHTK